MKSVAVLLLAVLVAGIPGGAGATGVKITVNSGGDIPPGQFPQNAMFRGDIARDPRQQYPDPRQQYPDPRQQYPDPRQQYPDPRQQNLDRRQQNLDPRQQPNIVHRSPVPVVVITQPVYLAAPQICVVPGYWAYAWVPQSYVSNVWVPGYYNYDALWVEGHYEPRGYTWGYYQPYWVPERAC